MSLLDRDDVPEPKSLASTRPVVSPRVTASRATPEPTTPPPTTSTCSSVLASASRAAARSAGPSRVVALAGSAAAACPFPACGPLPRTPGQARPSARRGTRRHHDFHPLELLEVGVTRRGHSPAQRAHQVHGPVRDGRGPVQDLLEGADRADLQAGT